MIVVGCTLRLMDLNIELKNYGKNTDIHDKKNGNNQF